MIMEVIEACIWCDIWRSSDDGRYIWRSMGDGRDIWRSITMTGMAVFYVAGYLIEERPNGL